MQFLELTAIGFTQAEIWGGGGQTGAPDASAPQRGLL